MMMNVPRITPHDDDAEAFKIAGSSEESQGFDFNLEGAWHYGCVLNSHPHTKPFTQQQAQQPSLSSQEQLQSDTILPSDDSNLLSKPATETSVRPQSNGCSKLESAAGSPSRNARYKRKMQRLFATYDEDNDGHISRHELGSVMMKLGIEISDDELNGMLRSVDKNGDGYVDFEEFVDFQDSLSAGNVSLAGGDDAEGSHGVGTDDDLREAFNVFDKDKDGFICAQELRTVLRSLGISADTTITSCQNMISAVDRNGDGRVDFLEFKDLMAADSLCF